MIRGAVDEIDVDELVGVIMLNVIGVVLGCKHGVPALRRNGGGAIVNTASAASVIGVPNASAYRATKGAVLQFTRAVAVEVSKEQIRVNAVCPGLIDTPFYAPDYAAGAIASSSAPSLVPERRWAEWADQKRLRRVFSTLHPPSRLSAPVPRCRPTAV
jgi:NAD(P)-dependent dehydrogenase (short-subunit alcohol dehydrogenase family)